MNKLTKIAAVAALSLVLLLCAFTVQSPTTDSSVSDAPANTAPVLSADAASLNDDEHPAMSPIEWKSAGLDKVDEPHETFESLIEKGVITPYRIPGFPTAGPFWEKYGIIDDEAEQNDSADVDTEAETNKVYTVTVEYRDSDGNTIAPSGTTTLKTGQPYTVSAPTIPGYTLLSSFKAADDLLVAAILLVLLIGILWVKTCYDWYKYASAKAEVCNDSDDDTIIPPENH